MAGAESTPVQRIEDAALLTFHRGDDILLPQLLFVIDQFHSLLSCPLLDLPFQRRIVMILDVVVCAAWQVLSDLRPPITIRLMELEDALVLRRRPLDFLNVWV